MDFPDRDTIQIKLELVSSAALPDLHPRLLLWIHFMATKNYFLCRRGLDETCLSDRCVVNNLK
jgi:hypothetical protein